MDKVLRGDAEKIIYAALQAVQPDEAVRRTLKDYRFNTGRKFLVAIGKAAWQMAKAATDTLGQVDAGIVITKYKHVKGDIPGEDITLFRFYLHLDLSLPVYRAAGFWTPDRSARYTLPEYR